MQKLAALWNLFHVGECIENPAAWKTGQVTATALGAVIMAGVGLASTFGYIIPIDSTSALAISGGIIAVVNVVLTIITTDKIGLPARPVLPSADTSATSGVQSGNKPDNSSGMGADSPNGLG